MEPDLRPDLAFDWEGLLLYTCDGEVVPVIGKEALQFEVEGRTITLERLVAERLAGQLEIQGLSDHFDLNEVVGRQIAASADPETEKRKAYSRIQRIFQENEFPIPETLRKLAEIRDFRLFVSTTFDDLLLRALREVRGADQVVTSSYYMQRDFDDLPDDFETSGKTVVYQTFGRLESKTDYALTDEDTLEVLHRLQDRERRPQHLFDELRARHLLFVGCGVPDGLARFLLRTLTNERLAQSASVVKIADSLAVADAELAFFLDQCRKAEVFGLGDVVDFVDRLHRKWMADNAERGEAREGAPPAARSKTTPSPERGSVFLSYKRADEVAVDRLRQSLENAGIKVWIDRSEIRGGADWYTEITRNIKDCILFLPCISQNAQVAEGMLVKEWELALQRRGTIAREVPFFMPIRLDETGPGAELIPGDFWNTQYLDCPAGNIDDAQVRDVKNMMKKAQQLRRRT